MAHKQSTRRLQSERTPLAQRSIVPRAVQPVVAKQGSLFLLSSDTGDVLPGSDQGLYFHDMRYLSAQTLRVNGQPLVSLLSDASEGHRVVFELTNLDLCADSGEVRVPKESLAVRRERCLGDVYTEIIRVQNYGRQAAELTLTLKYEADFADMFVVRGMHRGKRGRLREPGWRGTSLNFRYDGADRHTRTTSLHFSHAPDARNDSELTYQLKLRTHENWELVVTCRVRHEGGSALESVPSQTGGASAGHRERAAKGMFSTSVQIETSNRLLNDVMARSFLDLHMLSMRQKDNTFFAAGVPWYVALFGRDSLITALETLAFEPEVSANTLRVLAHHQGTKVDDWRDEQPGKILHELRVDELANLNEIPQTPYYGSVDSTPLFLALLGIYCSWTGSLDLFHKLHENVCQALEWIDRFGDSDGDGFVDFVSRSPSGSRNQGWKDSSNGIVLENGELAQPPIALPEVQGEVYLASLTIADLFERDGDSSMAIDLRRKAHRLYTAFNKQFWLPRQRYYAFCRQVDGRFSKSVSSNPAHALWTGIVDPKRARAVVNRVLGADMFSGWGIRTLSKDDPSYNPVDYQVGSVWPHDNAMIVAGMHRYGFVDEACQVFTAIMQAAAEFEHFRLPEVFAGYDRSVAPRPVKYPVACSPQAWAAGAIPHMLVSILGLRPNAFNARLEIRQPCLPDWLQYVDVRHLRVGEAELDLHYSRSENKTVVAVTRKRGRVQVHVQY